MKAKRLIGCCMGLATFVAPSTSRSLLLKSLPTREKLGKIPSIMETLEKHEFDFVEAEVDLLSPEGSTGDFHQFKRQISPFSLKPEIFSAFIPPDLKIVGGDIDRGRLNQYLSTSIPRAREAGGEIIIWGSGSSRTVPKGYPHEEAYKQIEDFLHQAADVASKCDICIAIEPMNKRESNTLNSLKDAFILADRINRKEIQIMLDFHHLMLEQEELSNIETCRKRIFHVHISDRDRSCPGDGDYLFNSLFSVLEEIDYKGRISLECNFQDFETESKRGLEFIKGFWPKT